MQEKPEMQMKATSNIISQHIIDDSIPAIILTIHSLLHRISAKAKLNDSQAEFPRVNTTLFIVKHRVFFPQSVLQTETLCCQNDGRY